MTDLTRNFLTGGVQPPGSGSKTESEHERYILELFNKASQDLTRSIDKLNDTQDLNGRELAKVLKEMKEELYKVLSQSKDPAALARFPEMLQQLYSKGSNQFNQIKMGPIGPNADEERRHKEMLAQLAELNKSMKESRDSLLKGIGTGRGIAGQGAYTAVSAINPEMGVLVKAMQENFGQMKDAFDTMKTVKDYMKGFFKADSGDQASFFSKLERTNKGLISNIGSSLATNLIGPGVSSAIGSAIGAAAATAIKGGLIGAAGAAAAYALKSLNDQENARTQQRFDKWGPDESKKYTQNREEMTSWGGIFGNPLEQFRRMQKDYQGFTGPEPPASFSDRFGAVEGRARGGPVRAGQPYVVGEHGPEVMVPNQAGGVVPNQIMVKQHRLLEEMLFHLKRQERGGQLFATSHSSGLGSAGPDPFGSGGGGGGGSGGGGGGSDFGGYPGRNSPGGGGGGGRGRPGDGTIPANQPVSGAIERGPGGLPIQPGTVAPVLPPELGGPQVQPGQRVGEPAAAAGSQTLAEQRAPYFKYLDEHPEAKAKLAATLVSEEPGSTGRVGTAETFFNRMVARGVPPEKMMTSAQGLASGKGVYYEPLRPGGSYERSVGLLNNNPELRKQVEADIERARSSNVSGYGTHNASAQVAENARKTQTITGATVGSEAPRSEQHDQWSRKDKTDAVSEREHGSGNIEGDWYRKTIEAERAAAARGDATVESTPGTGRGGGAPDLNKNLSTDKTSTFSGAPSPTVGAPYDRVGSRADLTIGGTGQGGGGWGAGRGNRIHSGNDIHAPGGDGSSVYSMTGGTVLYNGKNSGYGHNIVIKGDDGIIRRYATHAATDKNLTPGTRVSQGQTIGTQGLGHTHYEEIPKQIGGRDNPVYREFEKNADSNTFTSTSNQRGTVDPSGPEGSLSRIGQVQSPSPTQTAGPGAPTGDTPSPITQPTDDVAPIPGASGTSAYQPSTTADPNRPVMGGYGVGGVDNYLPGYTQSNTLPDSLRPSVSDRPADAAPGTETVQSTQSRSQEIFQNMQNGSTRLFDAPERMPRIPETGTGTGADGIRPAWSDFRKYSNIEDRRNESFLGGTWNNAKRSWEVFKDPIGDTSNPLRTPLGVAAGFDDLRRKSSISSEMDSKWKDSGAVEPGDMDIGVKEESRTSSALENENSNLKAVKEQVESDAAKAEGDSKSEGSTSGSSSGKQSENREPSTFTSGDMALATHSMSEQGWA
jgi:hypothetical protein